MTATLTELLRKTRGVPGAVLAQAGRPLRTSRHGAAVLCYHDVGIDPSPRIDYYLSPGQFRTQLEAIRSCGYTFVPIAEIVDRLLTERNLDGLAAVTFDDALVGVAEYAAPILERLHIPATVFAVTDALGVRPTFWPGATRTMTADELRALTATGLITLGSHTRTHASLPEVTTQTRARELDESRAALEMIAGTPVDLLAYPSGHHDADTEAAAAGAGYRAAFTFSFGRVMAKTDPYAIPRFCMHAGQTPFTIARLLARRPADW